MKLPEIPTHRQTKIVATIGPACESANDLEELIKLGINCARLNVSHGTRKDHQRVIDTIKKVSQKLDYPLSIMLDTRGAEIRTGDVQEPIQVKAGETILFASTAPHDGSVNGHQIIEVSYDGFAEDVAETDRILLDNGELVFDIVEINEDNTVLAKAKQAGEIGSRRHLNLPGADIDLPSVTKSDWEDIAYAVEQELDFVALSFIRRASEVEEVRAFLAEKGSDLRIVTKVETRLAIDNFAEILDVSDAIMIARGDLGAEVEYAHLPGLQDEIVLTCRKAGKPVIIATHMLESMREHPIPTRAEMTDVAHAAHSGTDCTMLSGETAAGNHPPQAVKAMDYLLRGSEATKVCGPGEVEPNVDPHGQAKAAVEMAESTAAAGIMVITRQGTTARAVSSYRPSCPIIAITPNEAVRRSLSLAYGITPLKVEFGDTEATLEDGLKAAQKAKLLKSGDNVVIISSITVDDKNIPSVQARPV